MPEETGEPRHTGDTGEPGVDGDRARQERIHRRLERRAGQRRGLRGFRPGLTHGVPWQLAAPSRSAQEEALDHEVLCIANAVEDVGEIELDDLRNLVGARYWGPGRFRPAVREAIADGYVVRVGRDRVRPADEGPSADG